MGTMTKNHGYNTFDKMADGVAEHRKPSSRAQATTKKGEDVAAREPSLPSMNAALDFARALPQQLRDGVREHPIAVVAGACGVGFLLGALGGSRIGRLVVLSGISYGLERAFANDGIRQWIADSSSAVIDDAKGAKTA